MTLNTDIEKATKEQLAQLEELKQKAIRQSGLTEAELAAICIGRLDKDMT